MAYMPTRGLRGAYASPRGGTKTNHQKPSIILIFIISLYASPAAHTPATIYLHVYARICIYRQASWQFTYSFTSWKCKWTSAYASLPTQQKSTLLSRVSTHTSADCEISGRQPTRLEKEFPRIHNALHSKKNDAQLFLVPLIRGRYHIIPQWAV